MYKKILVAIGLDGSAKGDLALDAARHLADEGAEITLLHVREAVPSFILREIPKATLEKTNKEVDEKLQELVAKLPGAKGEVVAGHAGKTIVQYANDHGTDCIIIASHKPDLESRILGSTANRVVHNAACTVHVIR